MDRTEMASLERQVNDEILTGCPAGTVRRAGLLSDDARLGPDELLVRLFVAVDSGESLESWAAKHQSAMRRLRRELSWRLRPARLLEFTVHDGSDGAPRIVMPHDEELGTGFVPDASVPADDAYDGAYATALRHVLSLETPPPIHDQATAVLAGLEG